MIIFSFNHFYELIMVEKWSATIFIEKNKKQVEKTEIHKSNKKISKIQ